MSCLEVAKVTGQHLLFCGTDSANWTLDQFRQAAQFARWHGIDTLIIKAADGPYMWYGGMIGYRQRRDVVKAQGVGVIPYTYSYGNTFEVLDTEITILKSFMLEDGVVCVDMEKEWNGQTVWAKQLCSQMLNYPGIFLVSTWADPSLQSWEGVLQALNPCVDAYMPQQYNTYLGTFWMQFGLNGAGCLQPTFDMTQDFGINDPVALAKSAHDQGHTAISIWHYDAATQNPGLLDQVLAAFPKTIIQSEEPTMMIDLTNGTVASHFEGDDNDWKCKDNGFIVGHAILNFYRKFGGDALCGLTYLGLPTTNESGVSGHAGVVYQRFERGVLVYDSGHTNDNPPGSSSVYLAHIDSGIGADPRIGHLQTQIADLEKQLDASTQDQEIVALQAKISQAIKDLQS